ncbi:MAG: ABC transporter ATP-binding protein [Alphaproteobacteria bacterium]|nr:MAG: ABC transporter ATP-binding protein [Alphaproteobacteria bacterium]
MALEFRAVSKWFGEAETALLALSEVSFRVADSEFVAIVGPSGCGKSTILNMAAGLYGPSAGEVLVSGERVSGPNAHVGFMLQKDLLLPWRSIRANVEFGLEARGVARAGRRARAMAELARCQLAGFEEHYPYQLSGGMRQRAALARTLAIDPEIILLDEPFSALDAQTKLILQEVFARTIAEAGKTTLLITHDLTEAVMMADRVLVLSERPGRLVAELAVPLPHRAHPLKRREMPEIGPIAAELFGHLHLAEKAA